MMGVIAGRVAVFAAVGGAISWVGDFPLVLLISSAIFILAVVLMTFRRDPLRAELADAGVANFVVSRGDNRHFAGMGSQTGLYLGNRVRRAWIYPRDIESMRIEAGRDQVSLEIATCAPGFPLIQIQFLPDASNAVRESAAYRKATMQAEEWLQLLSGKAAPAPSTANLQAQGA